MARDSVDIAPGGMRPNTSVSLQFISTCRAQAIWETAKNRAPNSSGPEPGSKAASSRPSGVIRQDAAQSRTDSTESGEVAKSKYGRRESVKSAGNRYCMVPDLAESGEVANKVRLCNGIKSADNKYSMALRRRRTKHSPSKPQTAVIDADGSRQASLAALPEVHEAFEEGNRTPVSLPCALEFGFDAQFKWV